jgi:hypothetical protein
MRTISGVEEKAATLRSFFAGDGDYDCLVVLSKDETEDIEVANDVVRGVGSDAKFNIILCVGADAPIFIVPRDGIASRSRTLLIVDGMPPTWAEKENCVCFEASPPVTDYSVISGSSPVAPSM